MIPISARNSEKLAGASTDPPGEKSLLEAEAEIKNMPLRLASCYLVAGLIWIAFSDAAVGLIARDIAQATWMNTYKGSLFIAVTTLLLYFLTKSYARRQLQSNRDLTAAHQQLAAAFEELTAADEELRQQFEELQKRTADLAQSEEKYRSLFDNMLNAFALFEVIADDEGRPHDYRFLSVNPAFEHLTGLSRAQTIGNTVRQLLPNLEDCWLDTFSKVALTGEPATMTQYMKDLGRHYFVQAYGTEAGQFAIQFLDVTEQRMHQQLIERMAYYDALIGLPNRYMLHDRLEKTLARTRRDGSMVAVMLLDLDDFKLINDALGHTAGDQLLKALGERLAACLHDSGTVARIGGDEFVILVDAFASTDCLIAIAERIIRAVNEPWEYDNSIYRLTAKVGIALYPSDGSDAATLIKQADIAMYKAKEIGKGNYQFYSAEMETRLVRRLKVEADLHRAVEAGELVLYYQPVVSLKGGGPGAEALLRWQHPERGMVPPLDFVPIAEETGLISVIGEWVVRQACQQVKEWDRLGLRLNTVSVNLSARQFQQPNTVSTISQAIADSGISPARLMVEITESVAMKNPDFTAEILRSLRKIGVQVALDDFGTGYSSLFYLKRFPISVLKIDRSFVKDIHANPESAAITKAMLGLAKNLGLAAIAEGVETLDQLNCLKAWDCDHVQGYIFSPPLPADKLAEWLCFQASKETDTQGPACG